METGCPIPDLVCGQWKRKTISLSRTNSYLDFVLWLQPLYLSKSSILQHLVLSLQGPFIDLSYNQILEFPVINEYKVLAFKIVVPDSWDISSCFGRPSLY